MMLLAVALLLASAAYGEETCPLGANWGTRPLAMRTKNTISMRDGTLTFNSAPASDKILRKYLQSGARMSPRPGLVVDTTNMSCAVQQRIVASAEAAGGCTPDVCGAYAVVRGTPPPAPPRPGGKWP